MQFSLSFVEITFYAFILLRISFFYLYVIGMICPGFFLYVAEISFYLNNNNKKLWIKKK